MYRIAIVAFTSALVLAAGVGADDNKQKKEEKKDKPAKTAVVPFELLKSGHVAVDVKVNGKGPYKLIFDTGAPISLVNNKLAKEAGLLDDKEKQPLFNLFGAAGEKKVKSMQLGEAKAEGVTVMVMDHPTVKAISDALKTPIYGLVGFPFFAQFKMTIDYQKKTLTLTPNGYKVPPGLLESLTKMIMEGPKDATLAPSAQWGLVCTKDKGDEDDGVDVTAVGPHGAAGKDGVKTGHRRL